MAATKRVASDQLAAAIAAELEAYSQEKADQVKKSVRSTAKTCKLEIQAASPVRTGKYRASWAAKVMHEDRFNIRVEVCNPKHWQITHLLENGHEVVRDGKSVGRAKAYPHIRKAEQNAIATFGKAVKMIFTNSG